MRLIVAGILAALALTACGTECLDDDCGDACADGSCGGSGSAGTGGSAGEGAGGSGGSAGGGGTSGTDHQLCVAACEHLDTCRDVLRIDLDACIAECDAGAIKEREAACIAEMECSIQAYVHCVPMTPTPSCMAACAHVYEDCDLEIYLSDDSAVTQWECEQMCSGLPMLSQSQQECLTNIECNNDEKVACLQAP